MICPHCEGAVFQASPSKLKARTAILVLHKSGEVETSCPLCKKAVLLPLRIIDGPFEIKKAASPRLVILDRGRTSKS